MNFLAAEFLILVLLTEPLGKTTEGKNIFLRDIWPSKEEIAELETVITPQMYRSRYVNSQDISEKWQNLQKVF